MMRSVPQPSPTVLAVAKLRLHGKFKRLMARRGLGVAAGTPPRLCFNVPHQDAVHA